MLDNLLTFLFGPKRTRDKTQTIPKPKPIYGDLGEPYGGPGYVNDQRQAPITWAGDPYTPRIGYDLETLQQQYDDQGHGGLSQDFYRLEGQAAADENQRTRQAETIQALGFAAPGERPHNGPLVQRSRDGLSPDRWTGQGHQELWSYMRPFDKNSPSRLTGDHFSMADHRRDYKIFEAAPVNKRRNTFRLDPPPWDSNIVDTVVSTPPRTAGYDITPEQNVSTTRSFRLA